MKNDWIREKVKGKTFADVGGLWGTVNERVSVAEKSGASHATMIDIAKEKTDLWEKFSKRCNELNVNNYTCISADITNENDLATLEKYDVVHCSGILYHLQDPMILLNNLHTITNEYLMLGSTTIPESIASINNGAYFIPALNEEQKTFFKNYFREQKIDAIGINWEQDFQWYNNRKPCFPPWWWLFTKSYVERLLMFCGFEIVESYESWPNKAHMFLCKKIDNS
jgi:2-polyprenyl-3-methyl-5-hydroxy-6-metoxy-1,4-benzoquinol methylase